MPSILKNIQHDRLTSLHLHIADFCFEIHFTKLVEPDFRKQLRQFIYLNYHEYVVSSCKKTAEYSLFFKDSPVIELYSHKKTGNEMHQYMHAYSMKGKTVNVDHHISLLQFQLLIKTLIQNLLVKKNGFLLHASAVRDRERLLVFAGPNTAGKSTIAQKLKDEYVPFADDVLIVRKIKNKWHGFQIPLDGGFSITERTQKSYPIESFFFIHQAKTLKIQPIHKNSLPIDLFIAQLIGYSIYKENIQSLFQFITYLPQSADLYFSLKIDCQSFRRIHAGLKMNHNSYRSQHTHPEK